MNPDQTINLNQNAAQCIHTASYWGKDIYYNICNHTQMDVPWGGADWLLVILGISIMIIIVLGLLAALIGGITVMLD